MLTLLTILTACNSDKRELELKQTAQDIFGTIESIDTIEINKPKAKLGQHLYSETALSGNDTQSCESCHLLNGFGAEPKSVSVGAFGKAVERNAPTTFNAVFHISQFWDGRAANLKEQAAGPILAAGEMGLESEQKAIEKISAISKYEILFRDAFPDEEQPVTFNNITSSIAEFESTLVTQDKFDLWMKGQADFTKQELKGLETFIDSGCIGCHNGPLLGGNSYQKLGVAQQWDTDPDHTDLGRFNVTKFEGDKQVFKVPSLRNVTGTAPYFHDGSIQTLEEAVDVMAKIQLNKNLSKKEIKSIVTFLETTKGKLKEK